MRLAFSIIAVRTRGRVSQRTKKARVQRWPQVPSDRMKRAAQLRIDEKIDGRDRILSFEGSADILSMPAVQELLSRYSKEDIRLLVIDLSGTDFINSPVWAVITLYARKRRNEARVAIVGMSQRIKGSFEMMGLQKELQTFADVETALREFLD